MGARLTKPARFQLVDKQTNHVWLKLLESRDAGMRLAIRVDHENHDDKIERTLRDARVGQQFVLVLGDSGEGSESYVDSVRRDPDDLSETPPV